MTEESETPLGVKMLADHLVKELERINDLLVHIRGIEKEKVELQQRYKVMEDELELRRNEIYQMKRETSAQYVIEERENWKAMLSQERRLNEKLNKDMEIYKSRIELLENQLHNDIEVIKTPSSNENISSIVAESQTSSEGVENGDTTEIVDSDKSVENTNSIENEKTDVFVDNANSAESTSKEETTPSSKPQTVILTKESCSGPPQPELPPTFEIDENSIEQLLQQKEELEKEISSIQQSLESLQQELSESKQINLRLTDQFIHKVDSLEADHKERENELIATIEGLKNKLDIELEKKWELSQRLNMEEDSNSGLLSFLWG